MMLYMLVKFDRRFSPELKDKIAKNLQRAFANGESLEDNLSLNDADHEQNKLMEPQKSLQRKQKVYEEMADKQL